MKVRPINNSEPDKNILIDLYDLYADYFDLKEGQKEYYEDEYTTELNTIVQKISQNDLSDSIYFLENVSSEHPVGMSMVCDTGSGTCEIKRVIISESARGKKYGAFFMNEVLEHAKKLGYQKATLDVLKTKSEAALHLYQSLGFSIYKTESFLSENDVVFLEKTL